MVAVSARCRFVATLREKRRKRQSPTFGRRFEAYIESLRKDRLPISSGVEPEIASASVHA